MRDVEAILKTDAFKDLGAERIKALRRFMELKNPSAEEIFAFMGEIGKGGRLSPSQQSALFSAFFEGLSPDEKKRIDNILEIVKAFS